MIKPFQEYVKENLVKTQLCDNQKAHALIEKAEKRLGFVKRQKITADSAQFVFEDAYDVMREASTALMAIQGFKPLSHEAVIAFLRDEENISQAHISRFDSFRRTRNKSLYEAQTISIDKAQQALKFAQELFQILRPKIKP